GGRVLQRLGEHDAVYLAGRREQRAAGVTLQNLRVEREDVAGGGSALVDVLALRLNLLPDTRGGRRERAVFGATGHHRVVAAGARRIEGERRGTQPRHVKHRDVTGRVEQHDRGAVQVPLAT